ncbi:hypothetical protein GUJ93_ZPchr0007g4833 [Zizania palustris]|uniref:CRIB domain-containing protein n=1 Tax=Zizania palustris TaxID=103762 RepID=A0A8J5TCY4_ZIZPA|nr:hypothetical protein GUJ93_ZPchr0007g4833 [Zizania palustris]
MSSSKEQRRFIVIPFSSSCRSGSSVDVVDGGRVEKKPQAGGEGSKSKGESLVARLLRGFKNLSQIFAVYEDEDEEEREMVIGLPTDVKHVAHIGWDGSTNTTNSVRSWNRAEPLAPPSSSSPAASTSSTARPPPPPAAAQQQQQQPPLPAFSMRQFELAMAAQAASSTAGTTSRPHGVAS